MVEKCEGASWYTTMAETPDVKKIILDLSPRYPFSSFAPSKIYSNNVYSVHHQRNTYVIKQLTAAEEDFRQSVILEAEMLVKDIHHDNIMKYYAVEVTQYNAEEVRYSLVLGHYTGGNLQKWASTPRNHQPIQHVKIRRFLREILSGLDYLHNYILPLIHCDIKPENLVLHIPEGRVVIIDFESMAVGKQIKINVYTPNYAAPELIRYGVRTEDDENISGKLDVWSFGCVAIVLATGKLPVIQECRSGRIIPEDNLGAPVIYHVGMRLAKPKLPELDHDQSNISSQQLLDLIAWCLEFNTDHRPTARELLNHPYLNGSD